MVNGRGRFGIPARGWRRTSRTADPQDNGQGDIVTRIVGDVAARLRRDGMPTRPRFVGARGMSIQVFPIFGLVK